MHSYVLILKKQSLNLISPYEKDCLPPIDLRQASNPDPDLQSEGDYAFAGLFGSLGSVFRSFGQRRGRSVRSDQGTAENLSWCDGEFSLPSGPAPEAYIKVSKEFEEATGIEVNFTILSYQELHQKLILDLTSGSNSFDALMFAYQWKREIDPYMADLKTLSQQVAGAPALALEDYPQRALQIYGVVDGKLRGLPVLGDATLILWNVDQYKQAGFDPAAAPGSWDEIYQRGAKITHSGQTFGYGLPAGKSIQATVTWILLFNAFGGKYFDNDMKPLFDSDAGIKAMDFIVSKLAKISPPGITTWDFPEMFTAFATGQTAQTMMWPGGLGGLSDPAQSQVAGHFKWCSPPGGSLLGGWACGVNKSSANRDAAYVYCAWLTSPEIVRKAALYGGAPCRISSFQDPELVKRYPYYPAILDGMNNSIEYPPVKEAEDFTFWFITRSTLPSQARKRQSKRRTTCSSPFWN
jgi:multiple sugar transport system substrate-binding protein